MTVLAWDGKTLAADKCATAGGGLAMTVTKIWRCGDELLGVTGNSDISREIRAWYLDGAKPEAFPARARAAGDDYGCLVVISRSGIVQYVGGPYPLPVDDAQSAWGSGRDYALAAMHLGHDARKGVEIAIHFQTDCGNGIDTLTLEPHHATL